MGEFIDASQRFIEKSERGHQVVDASDRFDGVDDSSDEVLVDATSRFSGANPVEQQTGDSREILEGEVEDRVVLDAIVRFAERRNSAVAAAEIAGDDKVQGEYIFKLRNQANDLFSFNFDVLKFVHEQMSKETEYFLDAVDSQSEPIADYLKSKMQGGLVARLTPDFVYETDPEELDFGEAKTEDHFGVFEQKTDDGQPKTLVYVPLDTIYALYGRVKNFRMFTPPEVEPEIEDKENLEAAIGMAVWATLGKWTIEQLDPRRKVMQSTSATRIASRSFIRDLVGYDIDDEHERYENTDLGGEMYKITNGFAGLMAYEGLERFLMEKRSELVAQTDAMKDGVNSWLHDYGYSHPEDVGVLDLMLARPMTEDELATNIGHLEPIAEALNGIGKPRPPKGSGPRGPKGGLNLVS